MLGFRNTPPVSGRKVNLLTDILPVASARVAKQITKRGKHNCWFFIVSCIVSFFLPLLEFHRGHSVRPSDVCQISKDSDYPSNYL